MTNVTLTIDLEDPTDSYRSDGRYIHLTKHILDTCDEFSTQATFFVVGRIAQSAPELIKEIAQRGHEIAYHSHKHLPLTKDASEPFRVNCFHDKDILEQISGTPVVGFRAPCYSLTPKTEWALDVLKEAGFSYSSSIMPTSLSRFGFPNAPRKAFYWPNGLAEFPLPMKKYGSHYIPYLGGVYLYLLPRIITKNWQNNADATDILWTYAHPYDLDRRESYIPMPNTPLWVSLILWFARQSAESKIRDILKNTKSISLKNRLSEIN